ncbi:MULTISPECIES: small ribosomal subunit biogenesis GTPase RsgA [Pseudidiomarina]|uniref:Small ribosomal subunit biogenesis GTPase RsgA n=2 Tax=Pseudidiomarina TaxID=2800384 RepID=A0A368UYI8_9GAMM|nr:MULTISPECIES: small ribosomal subunit biogenesis GTPase RsgA [Pseudidiomarina]PWW14075.1 ribosome biogenesis GTPase [Pseudidiomarina maritima]RBP91889.1 ribosome biogenesis GTPase [Pseudidiomarina tainanensis]RCW33653.1 ribosome biogenesis GTPase [Pseudidiomarina tainanensis]
MAKQRKLNKGQLRRMQANQQKRLQQAEAPATPELETDASSLGAPETGTVVSRFGQQAIICTPTEPDLRCHIRRSVDSLVCGDVVVWRRLQQSTNDVVGVIEAVQPRSSLLSRPDYYDGLKPVAANVDQILIVSSVLPAFSTQIIDRYLVACEDIEVTPVIILNKADLLTDIDADAAAEIQSALAMYQAIGYQVLQVSAKQAASLISLQQVLDDHVSIVVGQSGVGKSSLVNALLPEIDAEVGAVSDNSGLGQHTTTVATRYPLPNGGVLIDSPGIREFALWHLEPERVAWCFKDFRPYLGRCKFRDCKHLDDPECALQQAVETGDLYALRMYNFHRIIESMTLKKPSRVTPRGKKS